MAPWVANYKNVPIRRCSPFGVAPADGDAVDAIDEAPLCVAVAE